MKTFITLLILFFSMKVLLAVPPLQARLSISSFNTAKNMRVVIDGRNVNARQNSDGAFTMHDIRPGYHRIQVYQQLNRYGNNRRQSNAMQLVYDNNILIKAQYHVDICINRFGKAFVDESPVNGSYYGDNNWNNDYAAMDARDFAHMKQSISRESFENTRLSIARQAIQGKYISVLQVKEIMQLMNFENNKLELAKYYYAYSSDKNNYYQVAEALAFSSSREELMRFIQQNR